MELDALSRAASSVEAELRPGSKIGSDLTISGLLGEGGTAVVYSAYHAVLRREVAVKVSSVTGPYALEARARLIREAKMCASVRAPHLPRIYGLDELPDGTPYLVMEKLEGEALSRTLARWRVPVRYACEIGCALLDTLDVVHRAGLIHRDIKPSNLMVDLRPTATRRLCLLDFGIGKCMEQDPDEPVLTAHGALLGTPHYMAPEQIAGLPADRRSDLYSAGVVLYEMLAGRAPYEGNSVGEVLAAVLRDPIPPLAQARPELPESLLRVVDKATTRRPDQRFESARAMRIALAAASEDVIALGPLPELEALAQPMDPKSIGEQDTLPHVRRESPGYGPRRTTTRSLVAPPLRRPPAP